MKVQNISLSKLLVLCIFLLSCGLGCEEGAQTLIEPTDTEPYVTHEEFAGSNDRFIPVDEEEQLSSADPYREDESGEEVETETTEEVAETEVETETSAEEAEEEDTGTYIEVKPASIADAQDITGGRPVIIGLEETAEGAKEPQVAIDAEGNAIVMWVQDYEEEFEQMHSKRFSIANRFNNNDDIEWGWDKTSKEIGSHGKIYQQQIAMDGNGRAYASWVAGNRVGVQASILDGDARVWQDATIIKRGDPNQLLFLSLGVSKTGKALVTWFNKEENESYYSFLKNNLTWEDPRPNDDDPSSDPSLAPNPTEVVSKIMFKPTMEENKAIVIMKEYFSNISHRYYLLNFDFDETNATDATEDWDVETEFSAFITPIEDDLNKAVPMLKTAYLSDNKKIRVWKTEEQNIFAWIFPKEEGNFYKKLKENSSEVTDIKVVGSEGGNAAVIWLEKPKVTKKKNIRSIGNPSDRRLLGNNKTVLYASYYDKDTETWSEKKKISNADHSVQNPSIAIDKQGTVNVIWKQEAGIFLNRYEPSRNGWRSPVKLSKEDQTSNDFSAPQIAMSSNGKTVVTWAYNGNIFARTF